MKKLLASILSLLITLSLALSCYAFPSEGSLPNKFAYKCVEIEDLHWSPIVKGILINSSGNIRKRVTLQISGADLHEHHLYWTVTIYIGDMQPGDNFPFREEFSRPKEPADKLLFRIKFD